MGHHINSKGEFQSDRNKDLKPNRIVLSFNDPVARKALRFYANNTLDRELAEDILKVLGPEH